MDEMKPGYYYWDGEKLEQRVFCWPDSDDRKAFCKRLRDLEGTPFRIGFNPNEELGLMIGPVKGETVCADGQGVTTYDVVHTCPPMPPEFCID